jgi:hypothetical protein
MASLSFHGIKLSIKVWISFFERSLSCQAIIRYLDTIA